MILTDAISVLLPLFVTTLFRLLHMKDLFRVVVVLCVVLLFICNLLLFICNGGLSNGLQAGLHRYPFHRFFHYVILLFAIPQEENLSAHLLITRCSAFFLSCCYILLDMDKGYSIGNIRPYGMRCSTYWITLNSLWYSVRLDILSQALPYD